MIGHSAAGKSSCLVQLGFNLDATDMDHVLGTHQPPTMDRALDWLATGRKYPENIVAVSNHENLLKELAAAKNARPRKIQFDRIWFIYLRKPLAELQNHLQLRQPNGENRNREGINYTLQTFDRFDSDFFLQLQDEIVDCSGKSLATIADEISVIAKSM